MRLLRYGVFGALGLVFLIGGPIAFAHGLYELMETGSCGSDAVYVTSRPCPDGTGANVGYLVFGMFSVFLGPPIFALRGTLTEGGEKKISMGATFLWMWTALFVGGGGAALYSALNAEQEFEGGSGTGIFLAALFIPMGLIPAIIGLLALKGGRYSSSNPRMAEHLRRAAREQARMRGEPDPYAGTPYAQQQPARSTPPVAATPPAAPAYSGAPAAPVVAPPYPNGPPHLAGQGASKGDPVERLRELAGLRDAGVLTQAEFEAAKARVLADL